MTMPNTDTDTDTTAAPTGRAHIACVDGCWRMVIWTERDRLDRRDGETVAAGDWLGDTRVPVGTTDAADRCVNCGADIQVDVRGPRDDSGDGSGQHDSDSGGD